MRVLSDLLKIIGRNGQAVTFATGAASCSVRCVVGTSRRELDARQGGYGNQSAQTLTARAADITIPLTPHTTTATVGQTLWRVVSFANSQSDTGVIVITLGPINP